MTARFAGASVGSHAVDPTSSSFGSQTILDLFDCRAPTLNDLDWVRFVLTNAAVVAGATVIETVFHQFSPWGISGVVVIAESHLAIHIWPEKNYAAIDLFTCGDSVRMDRASSFLITAFDCEQPSKRVFVRGDRSTIAR